MKQDGGLIQQLLTLPVTFFRRIEELDEVETILSRFVGNGIFARIRDFSRGGDTGEGNLLRVALCCRHGNGTGLGITIEKCDGRWQVTGEWNDIYRFCPSCEGYEETYIPSSAPPTDEGACEGASLPRVSPAALCVRAERV